MEEEQWRFTQTLHSGVLGEGGGDGGGDGFARVLVA
jgi:hypothetical protein